MTNAVNNHWSFEFNKFGQFRLGDVYGASRKHSGSHRQHAVGGRQQSVAKTWRATVGQIGKPKSIRIGEGSHRIVDD
jgi:hypothetical protein